eukprot:6279572-Amphidinium_carterae.1
MNLNNVCKRVCDVTLQLNCGLDESNTIYSSATLQLRVSMMKKFEDKRFSKTFHSSSGSLGEAILVGAHEFCNFCVMVPRRS